MLVYLKDGADLKAIAALKRKFQGRIGRGLLGADAPAGFMVEIEKLKQVIMKIGEGENPKIIVLKIDGDFLFEDLVEILEFAKYPISLSVSVVMVLIFIATFFLLLSIIMTHLD
ncbi:MAG: hypothetical protein GXP32_01515 [Kiritimatiellaeota bacterium]|nr:hypothetical protein [Kiritimatiellota bacterium]